MGILTDIMKSLRGLNGKYSPFYPNALGRALTHEEMDYNLDLIGKVVYGYRVMGSNADGTINAEDDNGKVLVLYKVLLGDTLLIDAGAEVGESVWVPALLGGGTSETFLPVTANIAAGAIKIGDTVPSGTDIQELVRQLLLTTYYPTFQNPSFSLSKSVDALQEIGAVLNIPLTFNFNRGLIVGDLVGGVWQAGATQDFRAGASISYTIAGNTQAGNTYTVPSHLIISSTNTFNGSVSYGVGPQPFDSTIPNPVGAPRTPYLTPLSAGTGTASTTIEGVYPIFLGTSGGTEDKRALISHGANNIVCSQAYGETLLIRHLIAIPNTMINGRTITMQKLNTNNNQYENLATNEFVATSTTRTVQGDTNVPYTLYTKALTPGGTSEYRIVFN
jgi:hypothetical protein